MNDKTNKAPAVGIDCELNDWKTLNDEMVSGLAESGLLNDARWRAAFESVPRHVFVPQFIRGSAVISCADPLTVDEWRNSIYADTSLIVQTAPAPRYDSELPTSSSTLPSLMARMLNLLEIDNDSSILEVGTATGYNAALLCRALGDHRVTTLELHPDLAALARERLSALAIYPTVVAGNGIEGYVANAPYGRILATCAANSIPPAWVQQLTVGGRIVTDLRSEMSSSIAVLDKTAPDRVEGHLLDYPGYFMWLRPDPNSPMLNPTAPELIIDRDHQSNHTATTSVDPKLLGNPGLRMTLSILEPTLRIPLWLTTESGTAEHDYFLYSDDGSWSDSTPTRDGGHVVTQGGPRRVWDSVERAVDHWRRMGEPGRGRYGVTVTADGTHRYWVDEPARQLLADAPDRP